MLWCMCWCVVWILLLLFFRVICWFFWETVIYVFDVCCDLCLMYVLIYALINALSKALINGLINALLNALINTLKYALINVLINALINALIYVQSMFWLINALICGYCHTVGTCVHVYKHYSADCWVSRTDRCAGNDVSSNSIAYI